MNRPVALSLSISGLFLLGGLAFFLTRPGMDGAFENQPLSLTDPAPLSEADQSSEESVSNRGVAPSASPEEAEAPAPMEKTLEPEPRPMPIQPESPIEVVSQKIAYGFRTPPQPRSVDTVVIHSSYNASGGDAYDIAKVLKQYEAYGVGAHYLIGRDGTIYRLVEEKDIAYHAGVSKMPDGRRNVNDFSIGIELVGTEESGYTSKEYDALNALMADIRRRHSIKSVVGHSDIAPDRKTDPWKFDWKKLK